MVALASGWMLGASISMRWQETMLIHLVNTETSHLLPRQPGIHYFFFLFSL